MKGAGTEFGDVIPPQITGDTQKDVEENTTRYNAAIEAVVTRYPDQWFWVHRRWKLKPDQEPVSNGSAS